MKIGSKEWLEARKSYITATDLPVIMGVSKFKNIKNLWLEKKGLCSPPVQTEAMKRGLGLEPIAAGIAAKELDVSEFMAPEFVVSKEVPWAAASIDAWDGKETMVEIKCPGEKDHDFCLSGVVPKHYYPQLQWQMMVTELEEMYYFSYRPESNTPSILFKVKRNDEYIMKMLQKAEEFRNLLKLKELPAEFEAGDFKILNDSLSSLERELSVLLSRTREDEKRIDEIKSLIIKSCNGERTRGAILKFVPQETRGAIQYDKIPQLQGVDLEFYRKPSFLKWRIDVIDEDI